MIPKFALELDEVETVLVALNRVKRMNFAEDHPLRNKAAKLERALLLWLDENNIDTSSLSLKGRTSWRS